MFKIKRKGKITEMDGVKVGMIVEVNDDIFEIIDIRAESWGNSFSYIAKGRSLGHGDDYDHNLFLCSNFYEHVINNLVKVINDGEEIQPGELPDKC